MTKALALSEVALARFLPYWWVGDEAFVMQDGTLVLGFELQGVPIHTHPDEAINGYIRALRQFLNALPFGYHLQFLRHCRPAPAELFDAYRGALETRDAVLLEQREHSSLHLQSNGLRTFETYLFISRPKAFGALGGRQNSFVDRFMDWLGGRRNPISIAPEEHRRSLDELRARSTSLTSALAAIGVKVSPMSEDALASLAFGFLNQKLGRERAPRLVDGEPPEVLSEEQRRLYSALSLREQLVHSSLAHDATRLFMDDPVRLYRVMGLRALPPTTEAAFIRNAVKVPFEHWLSIGLSMPDSEKSFADVEKRRNRAHAAAAGHVRDVKAVNQFEEYEEVLRAMDSRDQRLFRMTLHLLFSASNLVELDRRTDIADESFRDMGLGLATVQMGQLQAFLGMLPGNAHRALHPRTLLTDNCADFIPIYESWRGDAKPLFMVSTRFGEPFSLDIPDAKRINRNINIFGGSGGGKTFLTLSLASSSILGQDSPLIVIDIGGKEDGSYYRICQLLGGDFVDLSLDGSNAINPFYSRADLHRDERGQVLSEPEDGKMNFLVYLAELAVRDPGAPPTTRVGEDIIRKSIAVTYQRIGDSRPPIFSDLAESLESFSMGDEQDRAQARVYGKTLKAFLGGPAGKLLNRQSRVSPKSNFIVFDLKGMENLGDTATAMLFVINAYVWNMIGTRRSKPSWVIYDETWKLMRHPTAAALQEELYRTARKLGAGVISITQRFEDFLASAASRAVLANTDTTFLLRHAKGEHELPSQHLGLNPREDQLFRELQAKKGFFSEFLMKTSAGSAVCRYSPSAFEYWVNTTAKEDKNLEQTLLEQFDGDRLGTLRHLARYFPNGAANAPKEIVNAA